MIGLLATLCATAAAQSVQTPPGLAADTLHPAIDTTDGLLVERAAVAPGFTARADLAWEHGTLRFLSDEGENTAVLGDVGVLHLAAGRSIGPLRLGAAAPLYLLLGSEVYDHPALIAGDLAISAKVAASPPSWLSLGAQGGLGLPMGGWRRSLGQQGLSGEIRALGEARVAEMTVRLDLGLGLNPAAQAAEIELDDELRARLGLAWRVRPQSSLWAELLGATGLQTPFSRGGSPLELLIGGTQGVGEATWLRMGLGTAITPGIGAAQVRLVVGVGR